MYTPSVFDRVTGVHSSDEDVDDATAAAGESAVVAVDGDDTENMASLETDDVFELLKNRRRRDVLRFLEANEGTATLSDVAEHVAARENGVSVAELTSKQRKRVYVALYQCHLPMMDRAGVVSFNRARGWVALEPAAGQLESYLYARAGANDRWSHYLSVTLAGGALYVLCALVLGASHPATVLTIGGLVAGVAGLALSQGRGALAPSGPNAPRWVPERVARFLAGSRSPAENDEHERAE